MKPINFFPTFHELLQDKLYNVDFHLHSTWTDGKNSIEQIIDRAKNYNLKSIAITDHIRKESTYFSDYKKEIDKFNEQEDIMLYVGFEAKIADFYGNIDVQKKNSDVSDIAIASVHRYPIENKLYNPSEFKKQRAQEIELELSLAALKKGGFNVLGHPGGMSMTVHKEFPLMYYEKIITECVKNEIAFDLNGRYHSNILEILHPLFQKHNPHISIGSDSHDINYIGVWNKRLGNFLQ